MLLTKYQDFTKPGRCKHHFVGGPKSDSLEKNTWWFQYKDKGRKKFDCGMFKNK